LLQVETASASEGAHPHPAPARDLPSSRPATAAERNGKFRLVLYTSATAVSRGDVADFAIEILNEGEIPLKFSDDVSLKRIVAGPATPDLETRAEPEANGGELQLELHCIVPKGNQQRFIARRGFNGSSPGVVEVPPKHTAFLKVRMPSGAFEEGECRFVVQTVSGESPSRELRITCTPPRRDPPPPKDEN
jgi:hypothetical protein